MKLNFNILFIFPGCVCVLRFVLNSFFDDDDERFVRSFIYVSTFVRHELKKRVQYSGGNDGLARV